MANKYNPDSHHRRSIRLRDYDYTQAGAYFITICSWNRECLFGDILDGQIILNDYGLIVFNEWQRSLTIRKEIGIDAFVVMPNHLHGIIFIHPYITGLHIVGANGRSPLRMKSKSVSSFVAGFKSVVTKQINQIRNTPGIPVWQRNYYEHIIRDKDEMNRIREYITNNPLQWAEDENNPVNIAKVILHALPCKQT